MSEPKSQTTADAFEKWATEYYDCKADIVPRQARDAWNAGIASVRVEALFTPMITRVADAIAATDSAGEGWGFSRAELHMIACAAIRALEESRT